jgi:hypothetical protein
LRLSKPAIATSICGPAHCLSWQATVDGVQASTHLAMPWLHALSVGQVAHRVHPVRDIAERVRSDELAQLGGSGRCERAVGDLCHDPMANVAAGKCRAWRGLARLGEAIAIKPAQASWQTLPKLLD